MAPDTLHATLHPDTLCASGSPLAPWPRPFSDGQRPRLDPGRGRSTGRTGAPTASAHALGAAAAVGRWFAGISKLSGGAARLPAAPFRSVSPPTRASRQAPSRDAVARTRARRRAGCTPAREKTGVHDDSRPRHLGVEPRDQGSLPHGVALGHPRRARRAGLSRVLSGCGCHHRNYRASPLRR